MASPTVLLLGTGRTAFHLGHALKAARVKLVGVVGREPDKTRVLSKALKCPAYDLREELPQADVALIAVSDDAIGTVSKRIKQADAVVVHTSGAQSMQVLGRRAHSGVFWPIMSLSPGKPVDFHRVPLVIDSSDPDARAVLLPLAKKLSDQVTELPHKQRQLLHVAAVLAANFPVFLLQQAGELLKANNLSPDLLTPLWSVTTAKAATAGAAEALTGPARRGDLRTIRNHLDRLSGDRDLRRVYTQLSRMILKAHGHNADGLEEL